MARDKGTIIRNDGIIIEGLVGWFLGNIWNVFRYTLDERWNRRIINW